MKRSRVKAGQIVLTLIYPMAFFCFLSLDQQLDSWTIPIAALILFSLLWENLTYLLISNLLTWVVAIPLWLVIMKPQEEQTFAIFTASLPFIILLYIGCVLIPEVLIVSAKNFIIKEFKRRNTTK
ncbi:hypothetical protein M3647_21535 [Paenibacillus cellulositrophicus]|uniref:hypothetical protein n=1 Tax=Paenibacillus cellulositrophicus TaxID=562959 RepID=UPI002042058B|nr:hypothetical protein [Paenibacillus cellulositrophicus]MCM3000059.1 hypothetical protein [Paenibacillus cellulositrophicus]